MDIKPIYTQSEGPLNVICFGSGSGTTIEALIAEQKRQEFMGEPFFMIRGIFVNKKCRCIDIGEKNDIPVIYNSKVRFFKDRKKKYSDRDTLIEYDKKNLEMLNKQSKKDGFTIDLIALAGYWSIVSDPILEAFPDKIINSHPADLSILDKNGKRVYAGTYGSDSIYQAMLRGDKGTKTCIHLVTAGIDEGEILVTSEPLTFFKEVEELKNKKYVRGRGTQQVFNAVKEAGLRAASRYHQELQKQRCDYPAYITAMNLIALDRFSIVEEEGVRPIIFEDVADEVELPYQGYDMAKRGPF